MSYPTGLGAMPDDGGVFSQASINQINTNTQATISTGGGQTINGPLTVTGLLTASAGLAPNVSTYSGATDAVLFPAAVNVAIFTSTGPDAATLATPAAADAGKILLLVNTNTTQNVVTTAANKITNGTGTAGDTLTAPAHTGATCLLVASNGFWNLIVGGTGTWVLSEV